MVDPLSLIPLHLETYFDNKESGQLHSEVKISDATGFVFQKNWKNYLITNWHVVSGRHPETNKPLSKKAAIPNIIKVWFHAPGTQLVWFSFSLELLDWETDKKRWIEHPRGREIDVVALPLDHKSSVFKFYPLEDALFNTDLKISPSESVSIIGFPFGLPSVGALPIWKTGHVASDIELDYGGKPVFLIDATVREGMSGAPVIARRKQLLSEDKRILVTFEEADKFLGVFSGGISYKYDCEIGMVWKPELLNEIIERKDEIMKKMMKYKMTPLDELLTKKIRSFKKI